MTLHFAAHHVAGDFTLDVAFESRGRLTALFGPSGSGKTTVINLIAGLIRPQTARIEVDGRVLVDTATGVFIAKHRRRIGYVFQDARLLPHLSVRQNLHYGRFFAPPAERHIDPGSIVELLGIGHLLDRRPGALSGGERQRVAIGRALLASPRLMLMDEPLASLDEARKVEILPYIERLRDETGIPIVYVSHAVAEVTRLATDVVVLQGGRSVMSGSPAEVISHSDALAGEDRDEMSALVDLVVVAHDADGLTHLRAPSGVWHVPRLDADVGTTLRARIRARDVMIAITEPSGISALNVLAGIIESLSEGTGRDMVVTIACGEDRILSRITCHSAARLGLATGRRVFVIVKAVSFADHNQPYRKPKDT